MTTFKLINTKPKTDFLGATLRETLAVTVFIEFLVGTYTFGLIAELLLMPFLAFVAAMAAMAGFKPEHALVGKLMNRILIVVGLTYLGNAVWQAVTHYREFASLDNARELIGPIVLSLMFMPFLYLFHVYVAYERVFVGINFRLGDQRLRRYAKWQAFLRFRTDTDYLQRWRRMVVTQHPTSRAEIDQIFADLRARKRVEVDPPEIPSSRGWSPFVAQGFLAAEGFQMDDYHCVYDGWQSSSSPVKLKRTVFDGTLQYYVRGDEEAATTLLLELDMMSMEDAEGADAEFIRLVGVLMRAALGEDMVQRLLAELPENECEGGHAVEGGYWRVALMHKARDYNFAEGYERELTITCRGLSLTD